MLPGLDGENFYKGNMGLLVTLKIKEKDIVMINDDVFITINKLKSDNQVSIRIDAPPNKYKIKRVKVESDDRGNK